MKMRKGLVIILPVLLLGVLILLKQEEHAPDSAQNQPVVQISLADLGTIPDWRELDRFQNTLSRTTFLDRLQTIYTKYDSWKKWITIHSDHALILTHDTPYRLNFSSQELPVLPSKSFSKLHIALDPGHIGGDFAEMEERHLLYGDHPPIQEGSMTLATAKILQKLLTKEGARVSLIREDESPVTTASPSDFNNARLFYRTAEIRARAKLVNETLKPDLIICLHYNASGSPVPTPGQHYHALINGAYHESELAHEDERFQMLHRLLSRYSEIEVPVAAAISHQFTEEVGLPPFQYQPDHPYSVNIGDNEALWARNLLANRLYQCPVVFLEPYVMNSTEFIARYKEDPEAIYHEYANAVITGLKSYFKTNEFLFTHRRSRLPRL